MNESLSWLGLIIFVGANKTESSGNVGLIRSETCKLLLNVLHATSSSNQHVASESKTDNFDVLIFYLMTEMFVIFCIRNANRTSASTYVDIIAPCFCLYPLNLHVFYRFQLLKVENLVMRNTIFNRTRKDRIHTGFLLGSNDGSCQF